jgi:hypothetical protein
MTKQLTAEQIKAIVLNNLKDGLENFPELLTYTANELACDLVAYAEDCDDIDFEKVESICEDWLKQKREEIKDVAKYIAEHSDSTAAFDAAVGARLHNGKQPN